jgi:hypothetical protein
VNETETETTRSAPTRAGAAGGAPRNLP